MIKVVPQKIVQKTLASQDNRLNRSSYRPEIDGIRALAVTAVIANHFNKELLPSGYLGVDIFFVISGFVITSSLASRSGKNFNDFLTGFYTRRIKRLVPALTLFVLTASVLICFFNPHPNASLKTGITALGGLSNLYLLKQATDYFATSTELNVFTHTWSLAVEEQFYFLFPVVIWLTGFGRWAPKGSRNLAWAIGAMSVTSLIAFVYLYPTHQPVAYFSMPTRFWELGAGCLLFLGLTHSSRFLRVLERIPPLWAVYAVGVVLYLPLQFAVQSTIAVVVLTSILIACLRPGTAAYALFTHPRVVDIGLISYPLYLWHWAVLCLSRWTVGVYWWSVPFQIALMLLLSIVSYRYVEVPLRRSNWSAVRWKSIAYGLGACLSTAILLLALVKAPLLSPHFSLYTGRMPSLIAEGGASLRDTYVLKQGGSRVGSEWGGKKCILTDNFQVGKQISVENCTLGSFETAHRRVMVIGDSFVASFVPAFDDLVVSDGYAVTLTAAWASAPVKEMRLRNEWSESSRYYWESVVPTLLARLKPGDLVFMINDMADFAPKVMTAEVKTRLKQLAAGLEAFSAQLSAKDIDLAVLHGNPFAREAKCQPVVATKQWFSLFGGPCKLPTKSDSLRRREPLDQVLSALEKQGKLRIVDLFDVFCPGKECTYNAKNGQILYRDENSHASVEGARLSAPIIRKVLTAS
jgi:peptidoglycan/LPS O-acetylase OafA/YrhL